MIKLLIVFLLLIPCISYADDYTQQQILDEIRDSKYRQEYRRTLDNWTQSIKDNNARFEREWNRNNTQKQHFQYKYELDTGRQYWDTDIGIIEGGEYGD